MQSVISYLQRGTGGRNSYRGNFAPQLIEDLVAQFKPRLVVDPMGGSYTTRDVCQRLGIPCWSSDLRDGFNVLEDEIPVGGDLGIAHPPYHNIVLYSGAVWGEKANPHDLSRCPDYDTFLRRLDEAHLRVYESLRSGAHLAILVGDVKKNGQLYPIQRDMRWLGEPVNTVIKLQHNCLSDRQTYSGAFIPIVHEYLLITRKPDVWYVALRETTRRMSDLQRLASMTWRSCVQAALEALGGQAELQVIYSALADHAKVRAAKQNSTDWQAQIRRALQVYPQSFRALERGRWALI